jgi:hypothetical protein
MRSITTAFDNRKPVLWIFQGIWSTNDVHRKIPSTRERSGTMLSEGAWARKNAKSDTVMKTKKKKSNQKPKVNLTLHEDTKQKLTALAQLEKRSLSNLIEIMADERWEKLADREGVDYAKTVAEIAGLKGLKADNEADRKVFRREILERVLKYKKR